MIKKLSTIQITVAVAIIGTLVLWWLVQRKKESKPGEGLVIVTPMPISDYSIDDPFEGEGDIPVAQPAPLDNVTASPGAEEYRDVEGYAVYNASDNADWMIHPERYDDYSPKDFQSNLLN